MEGMVSFALLIPCVIGSFIVFIIRSSWRCHFPLICYVIYQVTDLTLARENQTHFEEYLSNNPNANPGIDLTVTVLTTGFWPSYKSFDLNLPAEMVNS